MYNRIHIFGASGSGTSTLGAALARHLQYQHFDSDKYYWLPTNPPFQIKREIEDRQKLLLADLASDSWVLSGSLCKWGDVAIPLFDLVVFLWLPSDIRIPRLRNREVQRYGEEAISPDGHLHSKSNEFIEWAMRYDEGDENIRSRELHERWLKKIKCRIVRIEEDISIDEKISRILNNP